MLGNGRPLSARLISISRKKAKFEKIALKNYYSQACTFQMAAKESLHQPLL